MTLDELARMVAEGFEQTSTKTELKEGLAAVRVEIKEVRTEVKDVKHAVDGLDMRLSAYASYWRDELEAIKERVEVLEKGSRS